MLERLATLKRDQGFFAEAEHLGLKALTLSSVALGTRRTCVDSDTSLWLARLLLWSPSHPITQSDSVMDRGGAGAREGQPSERERKRERERERAKSSSSD